MAVLALLLGLICTSAVTADFANNFGEFSHDLYRTLLTNVTECQWSSWTYAPTGGNAASGNFLGSKLPWTGYGVCAENVESCIHLGTTPRPVMEQFRTPKCSYCCARLPCSTYPFQGQQQGNGICLLPKYPLENTTMAPNNMTFAGEFPYDHEATSCFSFGGYIANKSEPWWVNQCPMSGRCCLFPQVPNCASCGNKYGKYWNFSKPALARSDTQDELMAWKTAVHQMAGTGWNLGMQPVAPPGFSEQYSQTPPSYDSLVPPQMWNNFLNRPNAAGFKSNQQDHDDDDEDDFRGWCWQAAIMSKADGGFRCGAALLTEKYVILPASCASFTSVDAFSSYSVRLGGTDLSRNNEKNAVDAEIAAVYVHPNYNSTTWDNNIAIIELKSAVACSGKYICTICLPSAYMMSFANFSAGGHHQQWIRNDVNQCLATTWGRKTLGDSTSIFVKETMYIPVYNNHTFCESEMRSKLMSSQPDYMLPNNSFCAVSQPGMHGKFAPMCNGYGGGPLACFYEGRYYLTGLVWSWGRCDAGKDNNLVAKLLQPNHKVETPAINVDVFTDVAKFIPWIYRVIYEVL